MRRLARESTRLRPPQRPESFVMIPAAWVLHARVWLAAPVVVLALLALTTSQRWQALALPQVLTDIEAALPPADQVAEAREASLSHVDAGMLARSYLRSSQ
jgi:hypothetical protein